MWSPIAMGYLISLYCFALLNRSHLLWRWFIVRLAKAGVRGRRLCLESCRCWSFRLSAYSQPCTLMLWELWCIVLGHQIAFAFYFILRILEKSSLGLPPAWQILYHYTLTAHICMYRNSCFISDMWGLIFILF